MSIENPEERRQQILALHPAPVFGGSRHEVHIAFLNGLLLIGNTFPYKKPKA